MATTASHQRVGNEKGCPAYHNKVADPLTLLSIKFNGGVVFTQEAYDLVGQALEYDFERAMMVVMDIGNSRGSRGKTPLRSNMDASLPARLQTGNFTDSAAQSVKAGMMNRIEWMKILCYVYEHFPEVIVNETNLALLARNGCLVDLLDLCMYAVYGSDIETNVCNLAHVGSHGEVASRTKKYVSHNCLRLTYEERCERKAQQRQQRIVHAQRCIDLHPERFPVGSVPMGVIFERRMFVAPYWGTKGKCTLYSEAKHHFCHQTQRNRYPKPVVSDTDEATTEPGYDNSSEEDEPLCKSNDPDFLHFWNRMETIRDGEHTNFYRQWCKKDVQAQKQQASQNRHRLSAERLQTVCLAMQGVDVQTLGPEVVVCTDNHVGKLYQHVAAIFCRHIAEDLTKIAQGTPCKVSGLAAKWAPSPDGRHAKLTFLDQVIGNYLCAQHFGIMDHHGSYGKTLKLVRRAAGVPESFLGTGELSKLNFHRIASRAMIRYIPLFRSHPILEPLYEEFKDGKKRKQAAAEELLATCTTDAARVKALGQLEMAGMTAAAVQPHELVGQILEYSRDYDDEAIESMWGTLLAGVRKSAVGKKGFDLFMSDTSGSMEQMDKLPLNNAIALGIMGCMAVSHDSPFYGRLISFSDTPRLYDFRHLLCGGRPKPGYLRSMVELVKEMEWGGSTNLVAAFELLLQVAVEWNLSLQQLQNVRMVILSDMQFDKHNHNSEGWETSYDCILHLAENAGYQGFCPKLVFWNLAVCLTQTIAAPPYAQGVQHLAGYSAGNLKAVMSDDSSGASDGKRPQSTADTSLDRIYQNRAYEGIFVPAVCVRRAKGQHHAWAMVARMQEILAQSRQHRARPTIIKNNVRKLRRAEQFFNDF
jgi:hypothetical protein